MSGKIMGHVWDLELPHAHMLVLLAYADHADHQGNNVYPGVGLIAWKAGYSLRQAQRITDDLIAWGLLVEVKSEPGKRPVLRIDLAAGKQKPAYGGRQKVTRVKKSPVSNSHGGGDILADHGVTFSHDEKVPNGAPPRAKPPRSTRTNRHGNRHDDGDDARTLEKMLLDRGMYPATAKQIIAMDLDPATIITSVDCLLAAGWGIGAIADRLRASPPPKGQPYERPARSDAPDHGRNGPGRSEGGDDRQRPRGKAPRPGSQEYYEQYRRRAEGSTDGE